MDKNHKGPSDDLNHRSCCLIMSLWQYICILPYFRLLDKLYIGLQKKYLFPFNASFISFSRTRQNTNVGSKRHRASYSIMLNRHKNEYNIVCNLKAMILRENLLRLCKLSLKHKVCVKIFLISVCK